MLFRFPYGKKRHHPKGRGSWRNGLPELGAFILQPVGLRSESAGISHGLKTCPRHVFLTAFRFPYSKKDTTQKGGVFFGDPYGNRTHVTAVKGRCLNRLTNGPGSGNLIRTDDIPGMNRLLYQLSYAAMGGHTFGFCRNSFVIISKQYAFVK